MPDTEDKKAKDAPADVTFGSKKTSKKQTLIVLAVAAAALVAISIAIHFMQ